MATPPRARSLEALPTEIIEKVAANLDNTTLCALHATSRSIKDKSLHALTDISHHQDFAKYFHTVAFGPEERELIDPLHEEIVKRNGGKHSHPTTPSMSLDTFKKMRERLDALTIAQALAKFPKLKLVMLGYYLELYCKPIRPSWGRAKISALNCTSGHCKTTRQCRAADGIMWVKPMFDTVGMALEQLERKNVEIYLVFDREDLLHFKAQPLGATTVWYPSDDLQKRITGIQLHLKNRMSIAMLQLLTSHLPDNAYIKDVVLSHIPVAHRSPNGRNTAFWRGLQLNQVSKLTLRGLCIDPCALSDPVNLERVVLSDCIVKHRSAVISGRASWSGVLHTLQQMSRLTHVDLSRLQVATEVDEIPWHPFDRFSDTAMALKATWTTKEDVQAGLLHASITGRVTSSDFRAPTSPTELRTTRYLNLRWANFKANPSRYGWTVFEAHVLRWHRAGLASGSETRIDNGDIYPVPEAPALRSATVDATEKGARGAKRTASSPYSDTTAESQLRATKLVRQPKQLCVSGTLENSEQIALYSYNIKISSEITFVCSADGVCWRTLAWYRVLGSQWNLRPWDQLGPHGITFRCHANGYCKPTATWYGRLDLQAHTAGLHLLTYPEKEECEPQTSNEDMGVPPSAVVPGRPGEKAELEPQMGSKALDVLAPVFVPGNPTHTTRPDWSELQRSIKRVKEEIRADIKRLEEEIEEFLRG